MESLFSEQSRAEEIDDSSNSDGERLKTIVEFERTAEYSHFDKVELVEINYF